MERRDFLRAIGLGGAAYASGVAKADDEEKDFYFVCNDSKGDKNRNGVIDLDETEGPNKLVFGNNEKITFIASLFGKKGKGLICRVLADGRREVKRFDRDKIELDKCSLVHSLETEKLGPGKYSVMWEYDTDFFGTIFGWGKKASYVFEVRNESGKALRQKVARKEIEEMWEENRKMRLNLEEQIRRREEERAFIRAVRKIKWFWQEQL